MAKMSKYILKGSLMVKKVHEGPKRIMKILCMKVQKGLRWFKKVYVSSRRFYRRHKKV